MTPQGQFTRFSRSLLMSAGLVVLLVIAFTLYVWSERQVDCAYELRYQSFLLADELRQSSDDLTRMARAYVVTGDPSYKQRYQDILDIRDGKKPRPEDYWRIYWDLVLPGGQAPRPDSQQSVALLELMRQAGFTEQEFRKLAEAKANSDALTVPEFEAMKLVESAGPDGEADRARARTMMHDDKYRQAKAAIMKPIDDFLGLVNQRTRDAVQTAANCATALRCVSIVFGLGLMFMLWRTHAALCETMGGSVDEVYAQIAKIGSGDFSSAISVKATLKTSVLGWLSETQAKLNDMDRIRQRAEDEVRELNAELERRVRARTADLESANLELEAFAYSVSHDLRSPLRGIDGYSKVLLEDYRDKLDHDGQFVLQQVRDGAQEMGRLIDDLLAFSRMGRQEMNENALDMQTLVRGVFQEMRADCPERNLRLDLRSLPGAHGDKAMLREVLRNLLGNAIKFTRPRGEAVLEVTGERRDHETVYCVRDNGVGFDMQYKDLESTVFSA